MNLNKIEKRKQMIEFFRQEAIKQSVINKNISLEDFLNKDDEGKRILFVIPESLGDIFLCTALFKNLKELYPDFNLYVAVKQEYSDILDGNPYIYKTVPYAPFMEDIYFMEGRGNHKGLFEIVLLPHIGTQRIIDYHHNAKDKIGFNNKYESFNSTIN